MAEAKKRRGRPSSYRDEFPEQAKKLCRLGATDADLAEFFGVSEQTLNSWKKAHPDFLESLKNGKELADARVADALFHRAIGYRHKAVKIMAVDKVVREVPYVEHYPPDTVACIFWLKNRRPDIWRDKIEPGQNDDKEAPESKSFTYNVVDGRNDDGDAD